MQIKPTSDFGFHVNLANGITVSVQYGYGNYCENRDDISCEKDSVTSSFTGEYETAEVAVWDDENNWFQLNPYDDVVGWQTPEQVEGIIAKHSAMTLDSAHYFSQWSKGLNEAKRSKEYITEQEETLKKSLSGVRSELITALEALDNLEAGAGSDEVNALQAEVQKKVARAAKALNEWDDSDSWEHPIYLSRRLHWTKQDHARKIEKAMRSHKRARECKE